MVVAAGPEAEAFAAPQPPPPWVWSRFQVKTKREDAFSEGFPDAAAPPERARRRGRAWTWKWKGQVQDGGVDGRVEVSGGEVCAGARGDAVYGGADQVAGGGVGVGWVVVEVRLISVVAFVLVSPAPPVSRVLPSLSSLCTGYNQFFAVEADSVVRVSSRGRNHRPRVVFFSRAHILQENIKFFIICILLFLYCFLH